MTRPVRVHLTGGEESGWALDADVATTRSALLALAGQVSLTAMEDAEVVHSVWEEPILKMDRRRLEGKRIVCHVCNELMRTFEMPCMTRAGERIGLWVPISREAEANLQALGYRSVYIPYTVDTRLFTARIPGGQDQAALRDRWNIPRAAYVIGNFMRDSRAGDLSQPKPQKGVELLVEIFKGLWAQRLPIHILLAGPRRHWLRDRLREEGIPFTFAGHECQADDNAVNILAPDVINLLYHASDLHLVTSRWQGGPRAVLEAGATRTRILSTPVGMASDVLEPGCLFRSVDEGIARIAADIGGGVLKPTVERHYRRICERHVPESNVPLFRDLYRAIEDIPVFHAPAATSRRTLPVGRRLARGIAAIGTITRSALKLPVRPGECLSLGLWHEAPQPSCSENDRFIGALHAALLRQGARVICNHMSPVVDVHVCNAGWFDTAAFDRAAAQRPIRVIHRVDGPMLPGCGTDAAGGTRPDALNQRHAAATVFPSAWSFHRMKERGLAFVRPMIIRTATDPALFHPANNRTPPVGRKMRLIAAASSGKTGDDRELCAWLDENLDWSRYDMTVIGPIDQSLRHIRPVPFPDAPRLGALLRSHDLYLAAGESAAGPGALLEALSCGLPALYRHPGGHAEPVGFAGLPFDGTDDILPQLDRLATNLESFRACIWLPSIDDIARQYIELARVLLEDFP